MKNTLAIEIDGLIKSYGSVQALRGVNLKVRRGEIFGFLGPKTTRLQYKGNMWVERSVVL